MARFSHYEPCPRCLSRGHDRAGDNLAVYADGGMHCFSCHYHRFPVGAPTTNIKEAVDVKVLPADFSREVPARAWEWLLQYGLGWKYWQPFVGWSEKDSRLVFTVGEPVSFSLGRFIGTGTVEGQKPPHKWLSYGDCHRAAHVIQPSVNAGNSLVLVEDLISAHKVGQIAPCIPLFGTKVSSSVIPSLRHYGLPILMWLDKDQDAMMARRAAGLSVLAGLSVSYVSTESDPKCLSLSKIMATVNPTP